MEDNIKTSIYFKNLEVLYLNYIIIYEPLDEFYYEDDIEKIQFIY